jgi:hypothetical protein
VRKEVERPDSDQLIYHFGRILKCRLKPRQVFSAVRLLAAWEYGIDLYAAVTYEGFNGFYNFIEFTFWSEKMEQSKCGFDRLFRNGYGLDFRVETMSYPRYVFVAAYLDKFLGY